ncbi:response regulator transcription factor [Mesorhizobium sp. VK22B]|uniref:Response regulator transcription factor n=1 Tax=Mesorhizobium captivum TaxID=3072319 RepID=A0ABU4Z3Y7_9HYPH|nr:MULTISPECIES: response regulator transcription factor [unclassified Mesorhizobium]MDX8493055.1 response regulator transcription factor [Mesorhizobium sp. VK22B]MDX8507699.1 response regulator transcription factor [Mesorhizobium sp. VK22E]
MTRQSFTTVLVGPNGLLREGLIRILGAEKFRILCSAACVRDLLQKPLPQDRSILLIVDVDATDVDAGIAQIADFKAVYPTSHVVVLADHSRSNDIVSAFRAGADAYLTKVAGHETFVKAIELVMLGQTVLPAETSTYIKDIWLGPKYDEVDESINTAMKPEDYERELSGLSVREKCILRCLIEGESNKTIARRINIAEATVKVHVKAILRKVRVRNRTQAAVWAMNHGVLTGSAVSGNEKIAVPPSYDQQDLNKSFLGNARAM